MPSLSLDHVIQVVINELKQGDLMESCVQASTILAEVLRRTGFPEAFPLTVSVTACNAAMAEWIVDHFDSPDSLESGDIEGSGAFAVSIDMNDPVEGNQWPGHLVVILPGYHGERHAMLDLTIEQLNTPDKGIVLQPLNATVDDAFVKGMATHTEFIGSNILIYLAHPDDTTWQDEDGSMRRAGLMAVVAMIVMRLNTGT